MNEDEIKLKIIAIEKKLLQYQALSINSKKHNKKIIMQEIYTLYREYLKLIVQIKNRIPSYNNGFYEGDINCYFYALDLPLPISFSKTFEDITNIPFCTNLGIISNLESFSTKFIHPKTTDVLDYLKSDLDSLKIKCFDSAIYKEPKHNGYKIAIFFEENINFHDYHFIRQNSDGSWSSKIGYSDCITRSDNPFNYLNQCHDGTKFYYDLIKTIEVVKPTLKR